MAKGLSEFQNGMFRAAYIALNRSAEIMADAEKAEAGEDYDAYQDLKDKADEAQHIAQRIRSAALAKTESA